MKKTTGEILAVNEIREKFALTVKNYGINLRYNSRSGTHNMYKEYRDVTLVGAVAQMYQEMAGRHRARKESIQIISTQTVEDEDLRRPINIQFIGSEEKPVKFPLPHRRPRPSSRRFKSTYKASRPTTFRG